MKSSLLVVWSASAPALLLALSLAMSTGCKETPPKLEGPPITAPSGEPSLGKAPKVVPSSPPTEQDKFPLSEEQIQAVVNPGKATEYTGPTGVIEGIVRVKGDPPAMREFVPLPKECVDAPKVHAPMYRAGPKGELADTLVAVIGYSGFVRPSRQDKLVTIKSCSIEPTIIDLNLGQRLMVANGDTGPYMPQLADKAPVRRLALPGMSPVPLFITSPGAFGLTWLAGALPGSDVPSATVFVLPNALHTVTGFDGAFRITGVPVGKARVTASHLGMGEAFRDVEVKGGAETKVELTLTYTAPAAPSASVKPSGSAKPIH
ncbi:MAG: carboxypeptidase regulatory-like domain-containing protein [Deltaproteobacteria bacterium]|nr:carboxypeptidase regulatory-like domain-containing protein [Deltaproteobacteria bacterium]